jgi:hypothetical protein
MWAAAEVFANLVSRKIEIFCSKNVANQAIEMKHGVFKEAHAAIAAIEIKKTVERQI